MRSSLLAKVQHQALDAGLNLLGLVDSARYDACQPKERRTAGIGGRCGTILVLGTGGRAFSAHPDRDGAYRGVQAIQATLAAAAVPARVVTARMPHGLRFPCLGEAAGLGTVSPVSGLLLHPQFGPWVAIDAVMLVDGHPFGPIPDASITDRFQPCCGCHRPCIAACPGEAASGAAQCVPACLRRHACPLGTEHGQPRGAAVSSPACTTMRAEARPARGLWRLVGPFFRRLI